MKILITGAGGYLGRHMIAPFEAAGHELRLMDVKPWDSPHEVVVGSVEDLDAVTAAVAGCDAVVLGHMAPRDPDSYLAPPVSFSINVTGTANCFHAAAAAGIAKAVLISSVGAVGGHTPPMRRSDPMRPKGLYGLTKCLQETIGEYYHREHGMQVAALRPAYVIDGESMTDKYGRECKDFTVHFSDCRDIGSCALACLERDDIGFEPLFCVSTPEAREAFDMAYTCERLDWEPAHDFTWLKK